MRPATFLITLCEKPFGGAARRRDGACHKAGKTPRQPPEKIDGNSGRSHLAEKPGRQRVLPRHPCGGRSGFDTFTHGGQTNCPDEPELWLGLQQRLSRI